MRRITRQDWSHNQFTRRALTGRFLGALCLLMLTPLIGAGQQPDLPVLSEKFGQSPQRADFVIVLDRSGSMQAFWENVKRGIADFIDAVPEDDYVSLLYFEADAGDLLTPRTMTSENRAAFRQQILALDQPRGSYTDLGQGADRILDELNRPGANLLQFVFVFSDFAHDPPAGSRWRSRDCSEAAWQSLQEKKRRLVDNQHHVVKAYALQLPLGGHVGRDLSLFQCVFPRTEQVPVVDRAGLREWFERRRAEILRDKLRVLVQDDLQKAPLEIERAWIELGVLRRTGALYVALRPAAARILGPTLISSVTSKLEIAGNELPEVEFHPEPPQEISLGPTAEPVVVRLATVECRHMPIIRSSVTKEMVIEIEGEQRLAPEAEIERLNLPASVPFSVKPKFSLEAPYGYLPRSFLIALLSLVTASVIGVGYYRRPEYIVGEIAVAQPALLRRIQRSEKKKTIIIGQVQAGEGIQIPGANWRLVMRAFPGRLRGRPRGIYVKMEGGRGEVSYRGQQHNVTTLWVRADRGCTIRIGETRLTFN